ncbi:hypothetical protein BMF94_5358, partial [Rhodotorula taiwanensis]
PNTILRPTITGWTSVQHPRRGDRYREHAPLAFLIVDHSQRNLWGAHEPLNVIISAKSSADVLKESGFISYSRSLGLWNECANLHLGDPQVANLGDGKGWERELFVMRESVWPFPWVGSCLETITGGNHFRAYKQNGTEADSGAWFLAASKEVDLRGKHKIAHNGYNIGRDLIVERASSGSTYLNRRYETKVEWLEGLLRPGSEGMAHGIAQDGRIALLTVHEYFIFSTPPTFIVSQ